MTLAIGMGLKRARPTAGAPSPRDVPILGCDECGSALNRQSGFSLVEMMVAVAIGLVLVMGLTDLLIDSKGIYAREDQFARLQENARVAMSIASQSLRVNRSLGCRSIAMAEQEGQFTVKACDLLDTPSGRGCGHSKWRGDRHFLGVDRAIGYDNAEDLASASTYTDLPAIAASNVAQRWLRGDVLVSWGVDDRGVRLSGSLSGAIGDAGGFEGTGALAIESVPPAIGRVGRLALITDCVGADLFEISGPEDLAAGDQSIEHGATNPDGDRVNASDSMTRAYNWSAANGDRIVAGPLHGALVYPFSYRVFYICCVDTWRRSVRTGRGVAQCRLDPERNRDGRYRPALCAWNMEIGDQGRSHPLIMDVADMRLAYTGDADHDGVIDFSAESTSLVHTAAWVSDQGAWSGVRSASVELLIATGERGVAGESRIPARDVWPPNGGDGNIATDTLGKGLPADSRLYHRFLINVAMRARTPWDLGP